MKRRKVRVVAAVRSGAIPLHQALARFNLSAEEFVEWEREVGEDLARKRQMFREMKAGRGARVPSRRRKRTHQAT